MRKYNRFFLRIFLRQKQHTLQIYSGVHRLTLLIIDH